MAGQSKCAHEYLNMHELIRKLQAGGFMRCHTMPEAMEGSSVNIGIFHTALRLGEKASGEWYVLDSWTVGNGRTPEIVPEEKWGTSALIPSWKVLPTWESVAQTPSETRTAA